ncbi:glycosyltransferase family 4 protein [Patescibacteria group bacterium]
MKIGLNGQRLLWKNPAGPEKYTYHLYKALAEVDHKNEYVIYFDRKPPQGYFEKLTGGNKNFKYKVLKPFGLWTQISLAWELLKHPVRIFFSPTHTIPGLKWTWVKMISMIHGLEHKVNKEFKGKPIRRLLHPFIIFWVCLFSRKIIVPSQATKDAISKTFYLKPFTFKIHIVPEGVDKTFYKRSRVEIEKVRQRYNLGNEPYLFFLSTIQPRKNIPRMVEAFSKTGTDTKLVIAGKKGWEWEKSLEAPQKFGVEDRVLFLDRIPDKDRSALLSGAQAYVNFSLEEGFGLPLIEAMACETQTVVSDIPAYKEVGGEFPIFADSNSVDSMKNAMKKALSSLGNELKLREAKTWTEQFTWQKTATQIQKLLM